MLHMKLHLPQTTSNNLVARPELMEWLNKGLESKLTNITAPTGYGKTTILSLWAKEMGCNVAWVSLDRYDNDLMRFWSCIVAAIRGEEPNFSENIQLNFSGQQTYINFIDTLINKLQSFQEELVLILDDFHVIELADIHESMAYLLEYLPKNIHLYIASRMELPFPTARMRAKGEMLAISIKDMRFELEEGIRFFRDCMGVELTNEDAALFVSRTEGWISGLHLAAISLKKSSDPIGFIREFSGKQRGIAQYLLEEVLERQTEETKHILLQTSVLSRMNAVLCEVVTGREDGQIILESLERQKLFISSLDEHGEWYRYHHLFSDFLQQQFRSRHPEKWKEAHAKAACWMEARGKPEVAVEHWLICGCYAEAADLLEKHLSVLQDHRVSLLRWLETIPDAILSTKPFLQLVLLKMMTELGNFHIVDQKLRNLELIINKPVWQPWLGAYYFCSAETALYCKDVSRSLQYLELYDQYEPQGVNNPLQMIAANSISGINFVSTLSFFDSLESAEKYLLTCIRIWEGKGNSPFLGYIYYFYSILLIEWDRLDEAEILLSGIQYHSQWQPFTRIWFYATIAMAYIRLMKGETIDTATLIEEVTGRLNRTPERKLFIKKLNAEIANMSIYARKTDQLEEWIRTCGLKYTDIVPAGYRDYDVLARALIEVGQTSDALILLERIFQITTENNWLWDQVKIMILQSIALDKHGQEMEAFLKLESALHLAEPNGFVRSFINEGHVLGSLIVRYLHFRKSRTINPSHNVSRFYVKKLLNKMNIFLEEKLDVPIILTSQESKILYLVEQGYKNREIAEQLSVSTETVKKHLKNIFKKLEANSRVQAVNLAKELHLL